MHVDHISVDEELGLKYQFAKSMFIVHKSANTMSVK